MKTHSPIYRTVNVILISVTMILTLGINVSAEEHDPYQNYNEETFMDMDFDPNLATPIVPDAEKESVRRHMKRVASSIKNDYIVDLMRDGEVFVVTIPAEKLFLPNDTLLSSNASKYLTPIFNLMKDPFAYKIVLAIHSDDTGSELYRELLCTARLNSIYDKIIDNIDAGLLSEDLIVIPYAMGSIEPLVANDTRRHRNENRRVEFYFIPGPATIEKARNHTLE